jgi:hypothetical protein
VGIYLLGTVTGGSLLALLRQSIEGAKQRAAGTPYRGLHVSLTQNPFRDGGVPPTVKEGQQEMRRASPLCNPQ